jgi:hypothetical protein
MFDVLKNSLLVAALAAAGTLGAALVHARTDGMRQAGEQRQSIAAKIHASSADSGTSDRTEPLSTP